MKLRIWGGPLRGQQWHVTSGGKVLRVLNGTYERPQTELFVKCIRPGWTVIDVGAHVGYYTLLSSVLVGDSGKVVAFEPNPKNAEFLRRHVRANRRANVRIESAAVSDANGSAAFEFGRGSGTGHLATAGTQIVSTIRLDDFCTQHGVVPNAIKIDVEGAEEAVLDGAEGTLRTARPLLFLSTHGQAAHQGAIRRLERIGYHLQAIDADTLESCTEILATRLTAT